MDSRGSKKSKKRDRKRRKALKAEKKAQVQAPGEGGPSNAEGAAAKGPQAAPNAVAADGVTEDPQKRRLPFGPIPSLLSNTVFSSQSPGPSPRLGFAGRPELSRSNSLPAHIHRPPPAGNAVQFARGASRLTDPNEPPVPEIASQAPEPEMSRTAAVVMLLLSTGLVAVCAEFLVDAIPTMIASSNVSEAFIGLIILPIVGNAAEHVTAVSVATKNKMDLSIGVSVGSSIQIGTFYSLIPSIIVTNNP
jgi:Ca2+/H+ antiporter